jgi:hypothetical protein
VDNRLTLGVVHIVEWLRPGDIKTGRDLFDELEPLGIASRPEVPVTFSRAATRAEFIGLLRGFEEDFRATGRIPLLQIETHGDLDGIGPGPSANDGIVWPHLMEELIPLNRVTRLNLVVILAACEGIWGVQMLQPARGAAAFRGLIGPNRPVKAREMAAACMAFYRTVFSGFEGDAAVKAMNDAVGSAKETFLVLSAEWAFKAVYRGFLGELGNPETTEKRVEEIEAKEIARRRAEGLPDMFMRDKQRARNLTREYLSDHAARFEEMRREFFFIDLYPENEARFDVKIEDCLPKPNK